jgi:hypothetical protein
MKLNLVWQEHTTHQNCMKILELTELNKINLKENQNETI